MSDTASKFGDTLTQYGPPVTLSASLHGLAGQASGAFEHVQQYLGWRAPPPPPTLPRNDPLGWLRAHRREALWALGGVAVVGLALALAPRTCAWLRARPSAAHLRGAITRDGTRSEAVVVLGGDTPLGRALTLYLAAHELIVLSSVSSDAERHALELAVPPASKGYVRALVLDPRQDAASQDTFVHAVHSMLSLRFPLASSGDPYARPGSSVDLIGVINALTFFPDAPVNTLGTMAAPDVDAALHAHVTSPLGVLQRLVPLLASPPNRTPPSGPALVLSLVSLPGARVAMPEHGAAGIVAQAATAGIHTLRREHEQAWLTERSAQPTSWFSKKRVPAPRVLRWTVLEVDAAQSAAFASTHIPTSGSLADRGVAAQPLAPHMALVKTVQLLFYRTRPVRPSYTIAGRTRLQLWLSTLWSAVLSIVPGRWLDTLILTKSRYVPENDTHKQHRPL